MTYASLPDRTSDTTAMLKILQISCDTKSEVSRSNLLVFITNDRRLATNYTFSQGQQEKEWTEIYAVLRVNCEFYFCFFQYYLLSYATEILL